MQITKKQIKPRVGDILNGNNGVDFRVVGYGEDRMVMGATKAEDAFKTQIIVERMDDWPFGEITFTLDFLMEMCSIQFVPFTINVSDGIKQDILERLLDGRELEPIDHEDIAALDVKGMVKITSLALAERMWAEIEYTVESAERSLDMSYEFDDLHSYRIGYRSQIRAGKKTIRTIEREIARY